ncbi:hypothetical protein ABIS04_17430 [Shewanella sp. H8]|uniref:hypothetical protein n=1 Tax=Shewanella sp. H8 TaxID=3342676 RepID=UPI0033162F7F
MKLKYLSAILASSLLMFGCSSDDDDVVTDPVVVEPPVVVVPPVVVDPVSDAVKIDDASSVVVSLDTYNATTGALAFTLANTEGKALTDATNYSIVYFGFPDPDSPSVKPKAWKRWHVTQSYVCDSATTDECTGTLAATDTEGAYTFNVSDLDLQSKASDDADMIYKVAIEINGALASNEIELVSAN